MDDLVRDGVILLAGSCLLVVALLAGMLLLLLRELRAVAEGDAGFILGSIGVALLVAVIYLAIGRWLEKTGRI